MSDEQNPTTDRPAPTHLICTNCDRQVPPPPDNPALPWRCGGCGSDLRGDAPLSWPAATPRHPARDPRRVAGPGRLERDPRRQRPR